MKGIKNFFCASPASTAIVSGHRERRRDGTVPRSKTSAVPGSSSSHMPESPKSISSVSSVDSEHAALCNRSPPDQVVELEVAIDCKACERKVRKHISKMEGVKSFSIEMETRKVTIRGDVSPLGVLESFSKVDQNWDCSMPLPPSWCTTRYGGSVGCTQNPCITNHDSGWVCNPDYPY